MSKGKGGKIRNWKRRSKDFWSFEGPKDAKVAIDSSGAGHSVRLFGEDVPNKIIASKSRIREARKASAEWRRKHTTL